LFFYKNLLDFTQKYDIIEMIINLKEISEWKEIR
jgi:hypothetical protein